MSMWKIVVAFIVFAALALFMLSKGGDIDMSGEKHGAEATHAPEQAASAAPAAAAPAAPASIAASAPQASASK
jgi:hypothetical protein